MSPDDRRLFAAALIVFAVAVVWLVLVAYWSRPALGDYPARPKSVAILVTDANGDP